MKNKKHDVKFLNGQGQIIEVDGVKYKPGKKKYYKKDGIQHIRHTEFEPIDFDEHKKILAELGEQMKNTIPPQRVIEEVIKRRECSKCYAKRYRRENPEKIKIYRKMSYKRDFEKIRKYQEQHRDRVFFGGNRQAALERDSFECQECGMTQETHFALFNRGLTVDHIDKKGINAVDKNNNLDNLLTMCLRCHARKDKILVMQERYGELMEQDDSEYRFPKIRKMVDNARKKSKTLASAKRKIAKEMNLSFWAIDTKYYERKRRLIDIRSSNN